MEAYRVTWSVMFEGRPETEVRHNRVMLYSPPRSEDTDITLVGITPDLVTAIGETILSYGDARNRSPYIEIASIEPIDAPILMKGSEAECIEWARSMMERRSGSGPAGA